MSATKAKKVAEFGPYGYHGGVPDMVPQVAQGGVYFVTVYSDGSTRRTYSTGLGRTHTGKRWPADHPVSRAVVESHPELAGKVS